MMILGIAIQEFIGSAIIKKENGVFQVMMKDGFHSKDLNRFLFDKGIVASHLATQKKSLGETVSRNFSSDHTSQNIKY